MGICFVLFLLFCFQLYKFGAATGLFAVLISSLCSGDNTNCIGTMLQLQGITKTVIGTDIFWCIGLHEVCFFAGR